MAIVVGYVPSPEGRAALRRGAEEARLRGTKLIVISSSRGGRDLTSSDAARQEADLADVLGGRSSGGTPSSTRSACWFAASSPPRTSSRSRRRSGQTSS